VSGYVSGSTVASVSEIKMFVQVRVIRLRRKDPFQLFLSYITDRLEVSNHVFNWTALMLCLECLPVS